MFFFHVVLAVPNHQSSISVFWSNDVITDSRVPTVIAAKFEIFPFRKYNTLVRPQIVSFVQSPLSVLMDHPNNHSLPGLGQTSFGHVFYCTTTFTLPPAELIIAKVFHRRSPFQFRASSSFWGYPSIIMVHWKMGAAIFHWTMIMGDLLENMGDSW